MKLKMKSNIFNLLLILAMGTALLLPFQVASAASLSTTTNPLTVSMQALPSPARGFQTVVLLNGQRVQFGVTLISLSATMKGAYTNSSINSYGKIIISGVTRGTYCATISVRYAFGPTELTTTRKACHTY